jgi:hypothetical protein
MTNSSQSFRQNALAIYFPSRDQGGPVEDAREEAERQCLSALRPPAGNMGSLAIGGWLCN